MLTLIKDITCEFNRKKCMIKNLDLQLYTPQCEIPAMKYLFFFRRSKLNSWVSIDQGRAREEVNFPK